MPGTILTRWTDAFGRERTISARTRAALRGAMEGDPRARREPEPVVVRHRGDPMPPLRELVLEDGTQLGRLAQLPSDLPYGYHRLRSDRHEQLLLVAPRRCALPARYREWGWAVQLYAARSKVSWGIGDLGDLGTLAAWSREIGSGALIVSPMGAPNPGRRRARRCRVGRPSPRSARSTGPIGGPGPSRTEIRPRPRSGATRTPTLSGSRSTAGCSGSRTSSSPLPPLGARGSSLTCR